MSRLRIVLTAVALCAGCGGPEPLPPGEPLRDAGPPPVDAGPDAGPEDAGPPDAGPDFEQQCVDLCSDVAHCFALVDGGPACGPVCGEGCSSLCDTGTCDKITDGGMRWLASWCTNSATAPNMYKWRINPSCDDGDLCTGSDVCQGLGKCKGTKGTAIERFKNTAYDTWSWTQAIGWSAADTHDDGVVFHAAPDDADPTAVIDVSQMLYGPSLGRVLTTSPADWVFVGFGDEFGHPIFKAFIGNPTGTQPLARYRFICANGECGGAGYDGYAHYLTTWKGTEAPANSTPCDSPSCTNVSGASTARDLKVSVCQ